MFSFTENERKVWTSLLHGNGLASAEGNAFSDSEMEHARDRNKDAVGAGVISFESLAYGCWYM